MADVDEFGLPLDEEDETQGQPDVGKGIKQLRSKYREQEKQLKEALDRLSSYEKTAKQSSVVDVLTAKGVSPKLARFVLADAGDAEVNEDFVSKWVEENGELFGVAPSDNPIPPETKTAYEQVAKATAGARTPNTGFEAKLEALNALAGTAKTDPDYEKKLNAIFESA